MGPYEISLQKRSLDPIPCFVHISQFKNLSLLSLYQVFLQLLFKFYLVLKFPFSRFILLMNFSIFISVMQHLLYSFTFGSKNTNFNDRFSDFPSHCIIGISPEDKLRKSLKITDVTNTCKKHTKGHY